MCHKSVAARWIWLAKVSLNFTIIMVSFFVRYSSKDKCSIRNYSEIALNIEFSVVFNGICPQSWYGLLSCNTFAIFVDSIDNLDSRSKFLSYSILMENVRHAHFTTFVMILTKLTAECCPIPSPFTKKPVEEVINFNRMLPDEYL